MRSRFIEREGVQNEESNVYSNNGVCSVGGCTVGGLRKLVILVVCCCKQQRVGQLVGFGQFVS